MSNRYSFKKLISGSIIEELKSFKRDSNIFSAKDRINSLLYSDRSSSVLKSLSYLYNSGALAGSGYLSIIPIDHGIEHGANISFGHNTKYFNPENILKLAVESKASAIVSTLGVLGQFSRKYVTKIPLILKVNHNDRASNKNDYQSLFATVDQAVKLGASGVAATLYVGDDNTKHQVTKISEIFSYAHDQGLFTVLWCYLRGSVDVNCNDIRSQANYIGSTIEADIIKQKLDIDFNSSSISKYLKMAEKQVLSSFSGLTPLLNSGGSKSDSDARDLATLSLINKVAGGSGIIAGRKIFQNSVEEGINLIRLIQDIYLDDSL